MSVYLVAFLVMSTSSTQPNGRARTSENYRDDFIFDLGDDDYGIETGQGILEEDLLITKKSSK